MVRASEHCTCSFIIRMVIKHPAVTMQEITDRLAVCPQHGHNVGEPRKTPKGRPLSGTNPETFWSYAERIEDRRDFFTAALEFLERLKAHAEFLKNIKTTGGVVALYIDLINCTSIGDIIRPEQMSAFLEFGVDLGVEVFSGQHT